MRDDATLGPTRPSLPCASRCQLLSRLSQPRRDRLRRQTRRGFSARPV